MCLWVHHMHHLLYLQVLNVQVPFIFKHLVNHLNDPSEYLTMLTPPNTIITVATALVLACKVTVDSFTYLCRRLAGVLTSVCLCVCLLAG